MLWLSWRKRQFPVPLGFASSGGERPYTRKQTSDVILEIGKCHEGKEIGQWFIFGRLP